MDPYRPIDSAARATAYTLLSTAPFAALATMVAPGRPSLSRVAYAWLDGPVTLISELSDHTRALRAAPACALLVGEPEDRGDPLTHPRLTLHATSRFIPRDSAAHAALCDGWLAQRPKSKLYIDFTDFSFVRFEMEEALLNAGFGKAYRFSGPDLSALAKGAENPSQKP